MQRGRICKLMAALFLLTYVPAFAQSSDQVRVLALENAWNEAEAHRDANALSNLLAPTFSYTDGTGAFLDREQFLASIRSSGSSQIVNEGMKSESYGDVIIVTGAFKEQGTEKGKSYSHRGRFTDTWVQKGGQWLCVASQETLITH